MRVRVRSSRGAIWSPHGPCSTRRRCRAQSRAKLDAAEASSASFWVELDLDALSGSFSYAGAADYDDLQTSAWGSLDASGTTGAVEAVGTTVEDTGPDGTVSGTMLSLATW